MTEEAFVLDNVLLRDYYSMVGQGVPDMRIKSESPTLILSEHYLVSA